MWLETLFRFQQLYSIRWRTMSEIADQLLQNPEPPVIQEYSLTIDIWPSAICLCPGSFLFPRPPFISLHRSMPWTVLSATLPTSESLYFSLCTFLKGAYSWTSVNKGRLTCFALISPSSAFSTGHIVALLDGFLDEEWAWTLCEYRAIFPCLVLGHSTFATMIEPTYKSLLYCWFSAINFQIVFRIKSKSIANFQTSEPASSSYLLLSYIRMPLPTTSTWYCSWCSFGWVYKWQLFADS